MKAPLSIAVIVSGLAVITADLEAQSRFVYTNDDVPGGNTVSVFSIGTSGALTQIGSPVPTGGGGMGGGGYAVNRITISGNRLFVSNGGTGSISAFSIDPNFGTLTAAGSPFATGSGWGDISLAASSDGKFLFAGLAAKNSILALNIGADGSLSSTTFSAALFASPVGMKVSPDGHFLAVALPAFGPTVAMFSVASNGALAMINMFSGAGAGNLAALDIDCTGSHLFGGEMTPGIPVVHVFGISSTGSLSEVQGSPFSPPAGNNSSAILLSPKDQFLFVSNENSTSITVFTVASGGTLSPATNSPFVSGPTFPGGMATDQSGAFLYVGSYSGMGNLIYGFTIDAAGGLTALSGSPFNAGAPSGLVSLAAFPAKACGLTAPPPPSTPPPPSVPPPPSGNPDNVQIQIGSEDSNGNGGSGNNSGSKSISNKSGTNGGGGSNTQGDNNGNNQSQGNFRVAVLSSQTFNAPSRVDMNSLTFGHSGAEKSLTFCNTQREDVNKDRIADLVCHFSGQKANFRKGDTIGILKGKLLDGTLIQGSAPKAH